VAVAFGQPGNPGAHTGMGMVALADWWLTMGFAPEGVMAAAAAPARTAVKAKKRMAVFIFVSSAEMEQNVLFTLHVRT